jgi:hypothetical protein
MKEAKMARRNFAVGVILLPAAAALAFTFKEWSATLQPKNGSTVSGTAAVQTKDGDSLVATIQVKGAKLGERNPWHVHIGGCDSSGAPVGEATRYAPITIREDGTGESTARVTATLTVGTAYSVNVHRSPSDLAVISCGNLRPIAGGEPEGRKP